MLFPYADDRSYTPPDAPLEKYLGMLDTLGFERGALVQGSAHGRDNSAMLDALARRPDRLRGVAVADDKVVPAELRRWHALGVSGLRFNHFFRDGQLHYRGGVTLNFFPRAGAGHERAWLASAALDRHQGPAGHHPDPAGNRRTGGHRRHGPQRRARRDQPRRGSRACCGSLAKAGAGSSCRAPIASATAPPTIRTPGRSARRLCARTPSSFCGAATGRIHAWTKRCRTPDTCSICSRNGRRIGRPATRFSSAIRHGSMDFQNSAQRGP